MGTSAASTMNNTQWDRMPWLLLTQAQVIEPAALTTAIYPIGTMTGVTAFALADTRALNGLKSPAKQSKK